MVTTIFDKCEITTVTLVAMEMEMVPDATTVTDKVTFLVSAPQRDEIIIIPIIIITIIYVIIEEICGAY